MFIFCLFEEEEATQDGFPLPSNAWSLPGGRWPLPPPGKTGTLGALCQNRTESVGGRDLGQVRREQGIMVTVRVGRSWPSSGVESRDGREVSRS